MFFSFSNRTQPKTTRFVFGILLSSLLLLPTIQLTTFSTVHAVENVRVIGGKGSVADTTSAAANQIIAGINNAFYIKEFQLDGILNGLAKMVLKSITQSVLTWINSGFEGSPSFVTDIGEHLRTQMDQAAGDFIYNDPALNKLCSPFQLDVKSALATSYQEATHEGFSEAKCTLSDATDNVQGFLDGAFSEGGWPAWFEMTQNPVNTPTGAYLEAEAEMYARLVDAQGEAIKELDWGQGFLSFKVCSDTAAANGTQKDCDITTPGSVIADQLNRSLGAGQDVLITADEINEIIGALFAQLAQKALTGVNGLLGLGSSSYSSNSFGSSGNQSYLDALGDEGNDTSSSTSVSGLNNNPFISAIAVENENIALQKYIFDRIAVVDAAIVRNTFQFPNCFSVTLNNSLEEASRSATSSIALSEINITELTALNTTYTTSEEVEEKMEMITIYQTFLTSGQLTNSVDNKLTRVYISGEFEEEIDAQVDRINAEVARCEAIQP